MRKHQKPKENALNLDIYLINIVKFGVLKLFYLKISRFL